MIACEIALCTCSQVNRIGTVMPYHLCPSPVRQRPRHHGVYALFRRFVGYPPQSFGCIKLEIAVTSASR